MLRKIETIFPQGNFLFDLSELFDIRIIVPAELLAAKAELCLETVL